MNSETWKQIEHLFFGALEQPEEDRPAWLEKACPDEQRRQQVLAMLAADAQTGDPAEELIRQSIHDVAANSATESGHRLGAWQIIRELGSGGMGSVFLAERADDEYQRQVALKVIRGFADQASLERLRSERQILANLNHPNIAAMIDGGTTESGQPYLVMEYIEGVTVDQWCQEQRPSLNQRLNLFRDICSAVQYAHRNLVIHRDLKPTNVLVAANARPVLLDFGIAKLLEHDALSEQDATHGARYYTPGFSSPEQMSGAPVSTSSDIFSLGKLLAQMLAGNTDSAAPGDLRAIVRRATAEAPEDRYSSVEALDNDVANYLAGRPVAAASPRLLYRASKFIKRHRYAVSSAAAGAIVVAVLIGQVIIESQRSRVAEAQARVEAENANQVLSFLIELIEAAAPGEARGEDITVMQMLEQGRQRVSAEAVSDPALRAKTLFALGSVYRALESHQYAQSLLEQSATLARTLGDIEAEVRALNVLGMSAVLTSERELAMASLEQAVKLAREHPDIDPGERASAINNLGLALIEFGEPAGGRDLISEALSIREQAGLAEQRIATSYHNLAEAEDVLGNHREAMQLYRKALEIKQRTVGKLHPSYAMSLSGLGLAARHVGEFDVRLSAIEETLQIRIQLFGPDASLLYRDYNELANFHHDMGRFELAIENYQQAMRLEASSVGGGTQDWLFANNMGAAYKDMGLPERAEALYRQSVALRSERFGAGNTRTARAKHNLARVLLLQGRLEEARQITDEALAVRLGELGDSHPDSITTLFLSERIDHARDPSAQRLQRMAELIELLTEARSANNFGVLGARSALARALLEAGLIEQARSEMEATITLYREQLTDGHPLAAALELDLVRLQFMQGEAQAAGQRLANLQPTITANFPEASRYRRQFDCLNAGNSDSRCWL